MQENTAVVQQFKNQFFLSIGAENQKLTENAAAPLVKHDLTNQITFVAQGEGVGIIGDEIRCFSEGDVIMIPLKTPHSFKCKGKKLELLHYHWPKDFLETDRTILREDTSEMLKIL